MRSNLDRNYLKKSEPVHVWIFVFLQFKYFNNCYSHFTVVWIINEKKKMFTSNLKDTHSLQLFYFLRKCTSIRKRFDSGYFNFSDIPSLHIRVVLFRLSYSKSSQLSVFFLFLQIFFFLLTFCLLFWQTILKENFENQISIIHNWCIEQLLLSKNVI